MNSKFGLYDKNGFRTKLTEAASIFYDLPLRAEYNGNKKVTDGKLEVLDNILIGLHADPSFGNLKQLNMSTPFGQMQTKGGVVLNGNSTLIYQSPTGLFERRVKLKDLSK